MPEIFVVAEHREGKMRDVTFEILGKARELADQVQAKVSAILLCSGGNILTDELASSPGADEVVVVDDLRDGFCT